jgi:hypothetical protein
MRGQKCLPSGLRGAVLADTDGEFPAQLRQAGIDISFWGVGSLRVFLPDLLLDERAADQLLEGALAGQNSEADIGWIQHGEPDLIVEIAGQNGLVIDHGDDAVEDYRGGLGGLSQDRYWHG